MPKKQTAATFAKEAYQRFRDEKHPFKLIAEALNREERWGEDWDNKSVWSLLYDADNSPIPRKKVKRGRMDMGVPKDTTVPEGCTSQDDIVRFIDILLSEAEEYNPRRPFEYVAERLNDDGIHFAVSAIEWTAASAERYYRLATRDAPTNRLREKYPEHQVWPIDELADYIVGLKKSDYTHDAIITWLHREKIIHNRWKSADATWSKPQLSGVLAMRGSSTKKPGRPAIKPRKAAVAFVAEHPDYEIWMPDDIIVHIFDLRLKGFNHTAEQYAAYLNRKKIIRGNYTRGNPEFTGAQLVTLFQHRGISYGAKTPPQWVKDRIAEMQPKETEPDTPAPEAKKAPTSEPTQKNISWDDVANASARAQNGEEAKDAGEPEAPEPAGKLQHTNTALAEQKNNEGRPETPPQGNSGPMMKFPSLSVKKSDFSASAQVEIGPDRARMIIEYDGVPDTLLVATLEKLFGLKVSY
jgi:hypothetical protein